LPIKKNKKNAAPPKTGRFTATVVGPKKRGEQPFSEERGGRTLVREEAGRRVEEKERGHTGKKGAFYFEFAGKGDWVMSPRSTARNTGGGKFIGPGKRLIADRGP